MTNWERLALLALAPGVYLRAGVHCPNCRRGLRAEPYWRVRGAPIDWVYPWNHCGIVWDSWMCGVAARGLAAIESHP